MCYSCKPIYPRSLLPEYTDRQRNIYQENDDQKMRVTFIPILGILAFAACDSGKSLAQNKKEKTLIQPQFTAGPPTLVYKTRKDYANHVPVLLSGDKTKIVSYPDPKDFSNPGKYPLPIVLKKGYLLDER